VDQETVVGEADKLAVVQRARTAEAELDGGHRCLGCGQRGRRAGLGSRLDCYPPSRKHRPPTSDSAAPPGWDRRASHEDQIVNLGLMATDFPQYRLSFDRPE